MVTAAVVPFAVLALLGLAAADERLPRVYAVAKPLATAALFVVLEPHLASPLRAGVGAGLALATLGDALLVRKADPRFFYAGMGAFALAHVTYAATLLTTAGAGAGTGLALGLVLTGALTATLESRLVPRLRRGLALPVVAYGVSLTGTVVAAAGWATSDQPLATRAAILAGAVLLYLGDALYALDRFVRPLRFGQSAGLVLYWGGQLALMLGVRSA